MFKVIQVIQGEQKVDVQFYSGDDKVQAIAALVMAAAHESEHYSILSVRMEFGS